MSTGVCVQQVVGLLAWMGPDGAYAGSARGAPLGSAGFPAKAPSKARLVRGNISQGCHQGSYLAARQGGRYAVLAIRHSVRSVCGPAKALLQAAWFALKEGSLQPHNSLHD